VNYNSPKSFSVNLSNVGYWLTLAVIVWLLGSIGLGWLVKSFFILMGLILITPVVVFFGFRWWLQRNLVQEQCPICDYKFTGLNKTQTRCPNCNEPLKVENRHFQRLTPPGTIDVKAVEVAARTDDQGNF
jgi:hypothetical protein